MASGSHVRTWVRSMVMPVSATLVVIGLVLGYAWLAAPPATQREAEAYLDQPLLVYIVWDGVPYAVLEAEGVVRFDRLVRRWTSNEWPPAPQWQWAGDGATLEPTTDPASAELVATRHDRVIYGQINADEIVWVDALLGETWWRFAVNAPGYAVRLPEGGPDPDAYRWLDAGEQIIWSVDVEDEAMS